MRAQYLIIGNSAGGIGAAEAIREVDKAGSIVIISDEPYPSYSRPLISKYLAEGCALEKMLFRPAYFYNRNNIVPLLGRRVRSLGLESHTVEVDDGQNMEWEKLLLAVGGMPIVPTVEGMDKRGIFTFTTLDQAKEIDKFLGNAHKAVVIGGGLIGVSATEALAKRGVEVVIVEMKDRILPTILDERASSIVEEVLDGEGIRVIAGQTVTQVVGAAQVSGVVLGSGERIPCELVVVAIGVSPRIELTLGTDIKVRSYACTEAARCQPDCPNPPAHDAFTRLARV